MTVAGTAAVGPVSGAGLGNTPYTKGWQRRAAMCSRIRVLGARGRASGEGAGLSGFAS
jgi:hypothetical protein